MTRHELQLIGLASMFVSAKFEEMFAPEIHDFVYMSDKAYDKKDILRMEWKILRALDFQLGRPLPLHFLRRYTKIASHVSDDVSLCSSFYISRGVTLCLRSTGGCSAPHSFKVPDGVDSARV